MNGTRGLTYDLALMPVIPLLHAFGSSGGFIDEIVVLGGIGGLVLFMGFLSWRAGQERKKRRRKSKPRSSRK